MSSKVVRLAVLVAILAAACSGGSTTRPRYDAALPDAGAATPVSALSMQDKQQLCRSFDVYANTYVDLDAVAYLACLPVAIFTTVNEQACQASLNNCLALFPKPITVSATAHTDSLCFQSLDQCNATVAQLQGCANVNVDRALEVYQGWSCNRASDPAYRQMAQAMSSTVQVCTNVNNSCNQFAQVGASNTPQ